MDAGSSDDDAPAASTSLACATGSWTKNVTLTDSTFQPDEPPGPKSGASNCSPDTTVS